MLEGFLVFVVSLFVRALVWTLVLARRVSWSIRRLFYLQSEMLEAADTARLVRMSERLDNTTRAVAHVGAVLSDGKGESDGHKARLFSWLLLSARPSFVSLYQRKGQLLDTAQTLCEALRETSALWPPATKVLVRWRKADAEQWSESEICTDGGAECDVTTTLLLLTERECSRDLACTAMKSLTDDVKAGTLEKIDADAISKRLVVQCPDADMVFCFAGPVQNGYLPWHIKFTEFYECAPLDVFSIEEFEECMKRWTKVEHRRGK